eukprot:1295489-Lingulodinium_polyedra.AAC.1
MLPGSYSCLWSATCLWVPLCGTPVVYPSRPAQAQSIVLNPRITACGNLLAMGAKEQAKKAKRAAEASQVPAPKAASSQPPAAKRLAGPLPPPPPGPPPPAGGCNPVAGASQGKAEIGGGSAGSGSSVAGVSR